MKKIRIIKIVAAVLTVLVCAFAVMVFIENIDNLTLRIASEVIDGKTVLKTERVFTSDIIFPIISIIVLIATAVMSVLRIFTRSATVDTVCGLFPIISSALISIPKLDIEAMAVLRDVFGMGIRQASESAPNFLLSLTLILITVEIAMDLTLITIKKRQK